METLLIVLTLLEVAILVAVLAIYLIVIAAKLRKISETLARVTFGVRAIEKQTEPIGPVTRELNTALEGVAEALEETVRGQATGEAQAPEGRERGSEVPPGETAER